VPSDLEPLGADALARIETRGGMIHFSLAVNELPTLAESNWPVKPASGYGFGSVHCPLANTPSSATDSRALPLRFFGGILVLVSA
jgi:hypothetical protein